MTSDIRHSFLIEAPPEALVNALLQEEHLQNWWTREAHIEGDLGTFNWSGFGWAVKLRMSRDEAQNQVIWTCLQSNMQNTSAWEGTRITFTLSPESTGTRLDFAQTGYRESPCFNACDQGWAYFVGTSLKQYLETGTGIPYPDMLDTGKA